MATESSAAGGAGGPDGAAAADAGATRPPFTRDGLCNTKMERVKLLDRSGLPASFVSNSTKEELCLEYVENFRKQFTDLFPTRRPLLLTAKNECGVVKFVCTSLRPTQLPFRDMYSLEDCAHFFAYYIKYEPLEDPEQPPAYLPSPTSVLSWQLGDCFDMSFVLCSYLLGNGFDAYVCVGTAPKFVTLRDQSRTECPFDAQAEFASMLKRAGDPESGKTEEKGGTSEGKDSAEDGKDDGIAERYRPHGARVPESAYTIMMRERAEQEEEKRQPKLPELFEVEEEEVDDMDGRRVHAWVLVRGGKRDIDRHCFVEPSTGRIYPVDDSPYQRLETLFNNRNYWVNMQDPASGVSSISFDLDNSDNWEYVFIEQGKSRADRAAADGDAGADDAAGAGGDAGGMDAGGMMGGMGDLDGMGGAMDGGDSGSATGGGEDEDKEPPTLEEDAEHVLDLPPAWVPKLVMDRDAYAQRFGKEGAVTVLYRRAKLDLFASGAHPRGLSAQLSKFQDLARTAVTEVVELYRGRSDRLLRRTRRPLQQYVEEYFDSGRPSGLRRFVEILGVRREMDFYVSARLDGLRRRVEDVGKKVVEEFEGRDDCLEYRSVTLMPPGSEEEIIAAAGSGGRKGAKMAHFTLQGESGDMIIRKMTEKFGRNEAREADKDVRKRTYLVQDKQIREIYHYAPGRITSSTRTYLKEGVSGTVELTSVNPFAPQPKMAELDEDFRNVVALEKECNHSVREAQREAQEIMKKRRREEREVSLDKTIFETARLKSKEDATKEAKEEEEEKVEDSKVDYLTPFLQSLPDPKNPTLEEATIADRECRKALKERLIERVNIIQRRLEEENAALQKKQSAFQRNRDHVQGADEEFEQFCAEAMFRIGILEQRLQRQEETVLAKFTELEAMLKNDPRLAVLYAPKEDGGGAHFGRGRK